MTGKVKYKKLFMDPVHGSMVFDDELIIKIIDTPEFQRLRNIKQLGGVYYVYPGGSHNRFEHSLGVCHLAGKFLRTLRDSQPELRINDMEIRRVEIAGLCHDLGHGPFSHVFDKDFIPRLNRKHPQEGLDIKHEDLSEVMFDHLIKQNDLRSKLSDDDVQAIKKMIRGVTKDDDTVPADMKRRLFLYQIVANKSTGVDVDKWDYFARDCHQLGIPNSFDHNRCMELARVIEKNGKKIICFRDKEADGLYEMFHVRYLLHRKALQHKVSTIIEYMIMDAFEKADGAVDSSGEKCFKIFPASDGKTKLTMEETLIKRDMHAYTFMTDSIVERILSTTEEGLKDAREILKSVQMRDKTKLYTFVDEKLIPSDSEEDIPNETIRDGIVEHNYNVREYKEDIIPRLVTINYGQKKENPIEKVYFYSKDNPEEADLLPRDKISWILPEVFQETFIRIYYKNPSDDRTREIRKGFKEWCGKVWPDPTKASKEPPATPTKRRMDGPTNEAGPSTGVKVQRQLQYPDPQQSDEQEGPQGSGEQEGPQGSGEQEDPQGSGEQEDPQGSGEQEDPKGSGEQEGK